MLPRTVIYDPGLSSALPVGMSMTSGINAIAHAAEGLYAADGNPVISLMAEEGIRALAQALLAIQASPQDECARSLALYGTWLCGMVLGNVAMGLHHKLCHTLGGSFDLPHAETHAIVLPHALAYNAPRAQYAMQRIARALGADEKASAGQALFDLTVRIGAPLGLKELGLQAADLDTACDIAMNNQYPNPRPLERTALRELLQYAYDGRRPD